MRTSVELTGCRDCGEQVVARATTVCAACGAYRPGGTPAVWGRLLAVVVAVAVLLGTGLSVNHGLHQLRHQTDRCVAQTEQSLPGLPGLPALPDRGC